MILRKPYGFLRPMILVCAALVFSSLSISRTSSANEDNRTVKIGVLAKRGVERCQVKWGPTADYLAENIPGYSFEIKPLKFDEVNAAVEKGEVDFILANPFFYVELEYLYGVSRMTTLDNLRMGEEVTVFGGVIFCRADREDLRRLKDLKDKTFMAVNETSFGGWLTAWRELKEHGIDPHEDFASLSYGGTHDAVIYAVRDGKVDAGSVRTDVFERMAKEEKIRLEDFFVFSHDHFHNYACEIPFVHSTDTYPEWPLAKVKHTSEELAKEVTVALLEMSSDDPAAKAARCVGWIVPQQYQSVRECLKYLRIGRYKDYGKVTVWQALKQYWFQLACAFIVMCLIVLYALRVIRLNRRLKESEQKVRAAFDQTFQFVGLLDCNGTLLEINQTALKFAGVEEKDVLGKPFWETIWWTHSAELQEKLRNVVKKVANGQSMRFEVTHVAHDGTLHYVDFSLKSVMDEPGEVRHLVAEGHDISERKQAETLMLTERDLALQLSETTTLEETLEYCLEAAIKVSGMDVGGIYIVNDSDGSLDMLVHSGLSEEFVALGSHYDCDTKNSELIKQGDPIYVEYEKLGIDLDDIRIWEGLKSIAILPVKYQGRVVACLNVASRKMTSIPKIFQVALESLTSHIGAAIVQQKDEEALRESEKRFKKLSNLTFEGILIHKKSVIVDVNESLTRMLGYTREELIGKNIVELCIPQEYHAKIRENIVAKWAKPYELVATKKDGTLFPIEVEARDIKDKNEDVRVTAIRDITERKKTEEANARLLRAIEQADETVVITDAEGTIQYVNPAFGKITGYTVEEAIGQNPRILKSGQHDDAFYEKMWKTLSSGNEWSGEIINKKKDGTLYTENVVISPVFDSQGEIVNYVAAKNDITETKRLQALESRAERLETAGTIAGQVAHDFNNLLSPIMAYPEFIHEELPHDHKAHAYLDAIENAAQKMADINQDLLTMGRRGHYNQHVFDLNRVVLQCMQEMESRTKTVTCELDLCEDLMKIKGGEAQIHRMLTNLLVNAEDAMGDIGQVTIRTENYYADDTSIAFGCVPKGEYVKISISDNGCGIPEDIIQKILDPFFSTKTTDKKRGSGLGLSVVDAVMKDHNGHLDISSKVGHGTSFYLYFPITREDTGEEEPESLTGGNETVLVVDDDDIQREVTSQLLTKLGYRVSIVKSGEEAVRFLQENMMDIIVLDMVMPGGIDGTETYRQILDFSPQQKAIVLSGFSESDRVLEVQKLGAGTFVRKPVTRRSIAVAVRTELSRAVEAPTM